MSMSNTTLFYNVCLAMYIIHKSRGYCSFFVRIPINQGLFVFYTRYALHYVIGREDKHIIIKPNLDYNFNHISLINEENKR